MVCRQLFPLSYLAIASFCYCIVWIFGFIYRLLLSLEILPGGSRWLRLATRVDLHGPTNTITSKTGAYTTTTATTTYSLDTIVSNTVALNGHTELAGLSHDVFVSNTGFFWNRYTPFQTGAITLGNASINDPLSFAKPPLPDFSNRYRSVNTVQQSISVGDTIGFDKHWSTLLAASQSWIHMENYNKQGATTSKYNTNGISPTASLIYKPLDNMTAYLTYADSLQQGDNAPAGSANAGDSLAPYRSKESELGYTVDVSQVTLGAALYRIERPYAYVGANNVFAEQGQQVNRGLELTATGAVTRDLNIFTGISLLDPRLFDTGSASTSDKQILGLSRVVFNALLDYSVPAIAGLGFNINMNYASRRPGNLRTQTMSTAIPSLISARATERKLPANQ